MEICILLMSDVVEGHTAVDLLESSDSRRCRDMPSAPSHSAFAFRSSVVGHMSRLSYYQLNCICKIASGITLRGSEV
jgi:hypothetical protein